MTKCDVFDTIKKLHDLELFDDLLFYVELSLSDNKLSEYFRVDEQAYIFMCIADSYYQTTNFYQCEKWFDRAIKVLAVIKRQNADNQFEDVVNVAEIRYRLHKCLLKERKVEDALKCLETIPKAECTPRIQYAIVKLNLRYRKSAKLSAPFSGKIVTNLRSILEQVPEAFLCRSVLTLSAVGKSDDFEPIPKKMDHEMTAWLMAKQAESKRNFPLALEHLVKAAYSSNFKIISEMAHYYRTLGDRKKALDFYEKAHSINRSHPYGMDSYAALLSQAKMERELEVLAESVMSSNPRASESYVTFGYLARLQHRPKELVAQFAQRAFTLATDGRQKAEALLLKGLLYMDAKKFKECDFCLHEALSNDNTNVDVYDSHIRSLMLQKRSTDAHRIAKSALEFLGENNQRAQFLITFLLSEDPSAGIEAINRLENIVDKAPFITDALYLLTRLYEKHQLYEQGIKLLKKFTNKVHSDAYIHRILGDFLAKTNRPDLACSEYQLALNSTVPDSNASAAISAMHSAVTGMATPDVPSSGASSTVFSNRGPPPPVAPVRMRRIAQPYHARRNVVSMSTIPGANTQSSEADSLEFIRLSPPFFNEGADVTEEWGESATALSSNEGSSSQHSPSIGGRLDTSVIGVTTRAGRRNNSSILSTASSISSSAIATVMNIPRGSGSNNNASSPGRGSLSSAIVETATERDIRIHRRTVQSVREQVELLRSGQRDPALFGGRQRQAQRQQSRSSHQPDRNVQLRNQLSGNPEVAPSNVRSESVDVVEEDIGLEEDESVELDEDGGFYVQMGDEQPSMSIEEDQSANGNEVEMSEDDEQGDVSPTERILI